MGKFDMIKEKYVQLLCDALQLFYKNDAQALFNVIHSGEVEEDRRTADRSERKKDIIDERAMVGCVYRYMWCLMNQAKDAELESDIDIEYDRMVKDDLGYYEKVISCECGKQHGEGRCQKYFECNYEIVEKLHEVRPNDADENVSNVIRKAVRPDIIVHNRNKGGIENNGLVVEFKKHNNAGNVTFDMAKLYYFTCPKSNQLQYKLGAMVVLHPEFAIVDFICEQQVVLRYQVNACCKKKSDGVLGCGYPQMSFCAI